MKPSKSVMTLAEAIEAASSASNDMAVYAERIDGEWRPESRAVLLEISDEDLAIPVKEIARTRAPGTEYFLDSFIIEELFEDLAGLTPEKRILEVISYAENDA